MIGNMLPLKDTNVLDTMADIDWSNRKMLVIEDNPECILLIREIFLVTGLDIISAPNGSLGLNEFLQNPGIHIVLLDIRLPDKSGFSVLRRIREINGTIPVMAMSAAVTAEMAHWCSQSGFDGFITKPFEIKRLINMVTNALAYRNG